MTLQEFVVPDIGEGLAEVEIIEWHVAVGDLVEEYQTLVSVETDKAVIEIPSPYTGQVESLNAKPGDRVAIGSPLVRIEISTDGQGGNTHDVARRAPTQAVPQSAEPTGGAHLHDRPRAAPSVRRLARDLKVALESVTGTGRGGVITESDIRAAADQPTARSVSKAATIESESEPGEELIRMPLRGLRRTIAQNMAQVARVPHITSHREVEVSQLLEWRRQINAEPGVDVSLTPFFAMCVIAALRVVPKLNSTFDEAAEELITYRAVNLGIAVATDDGLLVPVVRNADRLGLDSLATNVESVADRARRRLLEPSELQAGTFTITNYGSHSGWFGTPLLRLPEIGIAGFGRAQERPWVVEGSVVPRPVLPLSVSVDHRIIDGDVSSQFTEALAGFLNRPLNLLRSHAPWS